MGRGLLRELAKPWLVSATYLTFWRLQHGLPLVHIRSRDLPASGGW